MMPLDKSIVIAATLVDVEVWEWVILGFHPNVGDDVAVGIAHQVLQNDVNTVVCVNTMKFRKDAVRVLVAKVVPPVNVATDSVQTVNGVYDVQFGNIGIRTKAPVLGPLSSSTGIFSKTPDVF